MVFNGALCTISVIVSNLSSLALSSYFVSILPTKRNLLTHLNTVLVFVMAALVNALVRLSRIISQNSLLNENYLFPVWLRLDLSHVPTLSISGNRSPVHLILAFLTFASCSCCAQPHQDLPDTQGEQKSRKELTGPAFIQPTKFNQLNHERRFKLVFFGLLAGTSIYTFAVLGLLNVTGIKIVSHNHAFICCR